MGHVDDKGNKVTFPSIEQYLEWLFSDRFSGNHVWAHWGGHYDHRFVIAYATKVPGWSWQTIQSGNLLIIIRIRNPKGREINFCESARLMPDSVEKIGKTIGLHKLDIDRQHIENLTPEQVKEYCIRDCEIVLKGLQLMKGVFDSVGCDFAYTLASIATRCVRRSDVLEWMKFYMKSDSGRFVYDDDMLEADEFCLPSYFGGRVEVFKAGLFKQNLFYYDITSSYPWSMTQEIPAYFEKFGAPLGRTTESHIDSLDMCGISEASIYIPRNTFQYPILPIRHEGKLIFPEGKFRGRWSNLELKALWQRGSRKGVSMHIHQYARFEPKSFLRPFVETFYALRKNAKINKDEFKTYAFKILLNSLYGKLVENVERKSILYGEMVQEAIDTYSEKAIAPTATPGIYSLTTENFGPFRHVAAGSYITSYSRLRLLEGIEACDRAGAKVYYCDTDSIITDKEITAFDQTKANDLGNFKLEHADDPIIEAEFVCPKVYRFKTQKGEEVYKVKGMPVKGLDESEKRIRWDMYNYELNEDSRKAIDALGLSPEDKIKYGSKEGIAGFMTDLNKGNIDPRKQLLSRQLKNKDSKRNHLGEGLSKPLYIDEREAI